MSSQPVAASDDPAAAFHQAMQGVKPLPAHHRILLQAPPPPPLPRHFREDERHAALAALRDPLPWHEDTEIDADASFVRNGVSRRVLRDLRQGGWRIEAELDLHGLRRAEAKTELVDFLHRCRHREVRCVRIIHGKGLGSHNREPVLRQHVRFWLRQRDEILAYVQARAVDGGSGAMIVLLKSATR